MSILSNKNAKAIWLDRTINLKYIIAKEYVDNGRAIDAWKLLLAKK
jgi:hypothetical protein